MRYRCDSCGCIAPDVVGPILLGLEKWEGFEITSEDGKKTAWILLCGGHWGTDCSAQMHRYMNKDRPPIPILTTEGGAKPS